MSVEIITKFAKQAIAEKTHMSDEIYDAFVLYYGEDNVDTDIDTVRRSVFNNLYIDECMTEEEASRAIDGILSSLCPYFSITIHWPAVTIKNDLGNKTEIYDLFGIIKINPCDGKLYETAFKKSTYTKMQFNCGYVHSHLSSFGEISRYTNEEEYKRRASDYKVSKNFCFGSGPIRSTLYNLMNGKPDAEMYYLLCRELDVCVGIESLAGGPYIRMSSINGSEYEYKKTSYDVPQMPYKEKKFIRYFLEHSDMNFIFDGNEYAIGNSYLDFALYTTKMFFKYARENKESLSKNDIESMLEYVTKRNGKFFSNIQNVFRNYKFAKWINENNIEIIKFKGKSYFLRIIDDKKGKHEPKMSLIRSDLASYMWDLVSVMINSEDNIYDRIQNDNNSTVSEDEHEEMLYKFIV